MVAGVHVGFAEFVAIDAEDVMRDDAVVLLRFLLVVIRVLVRDRVLNVDRTLTVDVDIELEVI